MGADMHAINVIIYIWTILAGAVVFGYVLDRVTDPAPVRLRGVLWCLAWPITVWIWLQRHNARCCRD